MKRSPAFAMCLVVGLAAAPSVARAYEAVVNFSLPAASAGGGGRHFTGSPIDGYTCDACHSGGEVPAIRVLGLPLSGYVQGGMYEITVDWSDSLEHVGAAVELTDMQGKRAGQLRLPEGDELQDPELCDVASAIGGELVRVPPEEMSDKADYCGDDTQPLPSDCRQVIHVRECGSQRLRFLWNAPSVDFGGVWFAGAAVAADHDKTDRGDGVAVFSHLVASRHSGGEVIDTTNAGCSVGRPAGESGQAWLWFAGWLAIASRARRGIKKL